MQPSPICADQVRARNTSSRSPLGQTRSRAKLVQRSLADDAAAAQKNESIADARRVAQLMDREKQRSPFCARLPATPHDVARLPEIKPVERLVEHQHGCGREQADREKHATVLAL